MGPTTKTNQCQSSWPSVSIFHSYLKIKSKLIKNLPFLFNFSTINNNFYIRDCNRSFGNIRGDHNLSKMFRWLENFLMISSKGSIEWVDFGIGHLLRFLPNLVNNRLNFILTGEENKETVRKRFGFMELKNGSIDLVEVVGVGFFNVENLKKMRLMNFFLNSKNQNNKKS